MTKKEQYEKRTEELMEIIVKEHEFELVDVEYVKEGGVWYLRAYIDKEEGISVEDCAVVSRQMSELLDEEDYIEDSYIFEVSSPGLTRPLKKDKDFERNIGKEIELRTYQAIKIHNSKRKEKEFYGILKAYDTNTVTIEIEEEQVNFERSDIALIRLAFHF